MSCFVTFNGWSQVGTDIYLRNIANHFTNNIISLNYNDYHNLYSTNESEWLDNITQLIPQNIDTIIAWSLGAKIALLLCSNKLIRVKNLILISPPFSLPNQKDTDNYNYLNDYQNFIRVFQKNIKLSLNIFHKNLYLINEDRDNAIILYKNLNLILNNINQASKYSDILYHLLTYLGESYNLEVKSFDSINIFLFHGTDDTIIKNLSSIELQQYLPQSKLILLQNYNHLPWLFNHNQIVKNLNLYQL